MKLKDKLTKLKEERVNDQNEFKAEKQALNDKLDKLLALTQKERVDTNLNKIESEKYIKQIEQLKISESKVKEQLKKMSTDNANYLREYHDIQKKNEDLLEKVSVLNGKLLDFINL